MIQGGNWRNLLEQDARDNAALVDVSREPRDTHGVQFKMHCSETIPTNNDVVLFFPNARAGTIIDARKYSAYPALDRSIDEALKATTLVTTTSGSRDVSLPLRGKGGGEGLPFAIHHCGYYYRFWSAYVHHTYYLLWMTDFTAFNDKGPLGPSLPNVPVVFEMDGLGGIVAITPLIYEGHEEGTWGPVKDPAESISKIHFPNTELFTREVPRQRLLSSSMVNGVGGRTIGHEEGRINIKNVNVGGTASLEIEPSADLELEGFDPK
jgi:hypothetical protein